jgi:acetylornithine aminotransferase
MLGIELDRPCGPCSAVRGGRPDDERHRRQGIRLLPALILSHDEARQIVAILVPLIKEFLAHPE